MQIFNKAGFWLSKLCFDAYRIPCLFMHMEIPSLFMDVMLVYLGYCSCFGQIVDLLRV